MTEGTIRKQGLYEGRVIQRKGLYERGGKGSAIGRKEGRKDYIKEGKDYVKEGLYE